MTRTAVRLRRKDGEPRPPRRRQRGRADAASREGAETPRYLRIASATFGEALPHALELGGDIDARADTRTPEAAGEALVLLGNAQSLAAPHGAPREDGAMREAVAAARPPELPLPASIADGTGSRREAPRKGEPARPSNPVQPEQQKQPETKAGGDAEGEHAEGEDKSEGKQGDSEEGVALAAAPAGAASFLVASEEDAEGADTMPAALDAVADAPLDAPPLKISETGAQWPVAAMLSEDVLPKPTAPGTPRASAQPPPAAPGETPAPPTKAAPPSNDPEVVRRKEVAARGAAEKAYAEIVRTAQREQQAFVTRANALTHYMAQAYGLRTDEIAHSHDADAASIDAAAERATSRIEAAAASAVLSLDSASAQTAAAVEAAGGSAYGLINAGETAAVGQIAAAVSGLVAGHTAAYNSVIQVVTADADAALLALNDWRDARADNYPTTGDPLEGAKNESRQSRIPRLVEPEATRLTQRLEQKTTAWSGARDTAVNGLSCNYRCALEAENTKMAKEGRKSVETALGSARKTLAKQTREGQRALRDLRRSWLQQVDVQARSTRSRLSSEARSALFAARTEAQGAVGGVEAAARGAMPSYWRAAQGFEQTLKRAASGGAAAIQQTAERSPAPLLDGVRRTSAGLDERLSLNRSKLDNGLNARVETTRQSADLQRTAFDTSLEEKNTEASTRFDESLAGYLDAFGGLASSVSQAAVSWAQPVTTRMASQIASKRAEAQAALTQTLTGQAPAPAAGAAAPAAGGESGPDCSGCASESAAPAGGAPGAAPAGGGEAQGLTAQADAEREYFNARADPAAFYATQLTETGAQVQTQLSSRAANVAQKFEGGFAGTVDEEGVIAQLRGLTQPKGHALDVAVYPTFGGGSLDSHLRHYLGSDSGDYATASAYLAGDAVEGARRELADSTGFFNDDEARIEATMRSLSPDQLASLGASAPDVMSEVRNALDGTDQQVFDALAAGNHAQADAYRMRDAVDSARREGDAAAVNRAIEQYTAAPAEGDWRATQEMSADERRTAVVRELGGIVPDAAVEQAAGAGGVGSMTAEQRAVAYVTRDIQVVVSDGEGGGHVETRSITGANRDLAEALLLHGERSDQARAARIGVEIQRTGEAPDPIAIDRATFDERFVADPSHATPEEREAHRAAAEQRARVMMLAAERYAGGDAAPGADGQPARVENDPTAAMSDTRVTTARDRLITQLRSRFGSDSVGADLAAGLLTDARPTPATAALAMRQAMYSHTGTNEELLFRFTERMTRSEIAQMRTEFASQTRDDDHPNGLSLDAELGTFGEGGTFTELSGDDRLRMERALRGVATNDRERLENAAFALDQQRREAGGLGSWLAEGTLAERVMNNTQGQLELLAGGPIALDRRGDLMSTLPNFNPQTGEYTGTDRDSFAATTSVAQTVADNYAKRIDAFADVATTGIAVLGAIAAAVITVATGGAAGPLIAAAVIAGLASMSANYAIKGGRYGWEQAGIDLAMTAVQAITAGVGAQLGAAAQVASKGAAAASAASRSVASLARIFTGNLVIDQIIVGAITGSIGGLAGAAVNERTWEGKDPVGALLGGLLRGAMAGAATAAVTNSIENIGRQGRTISDRLQALAAQGNVRNALGAMATRGLARGAIAGLGGMAGRSTELAFDAATGEFHGDIGDALGEIGQAGLHAALQGMGEGAAEAAGQRFHNQRLHAAETAIARERESLGLPRLDSEHLTAAAHDLMFLNQHGRNRDSFGRAVNLDHVATHGGLAPHTADAPALEPPVRTARHESDEAAASRGPASVEEATAPVPGEPTAMLPRADVAAEAAAPQSRGGAAAEAAATRSHAQASAEAALPRARGDATADNAGPRAHGDEQGQRATARGAAEGEATRGRPEGPEAPRAAGEASEAPARIAAPQPDEGGGGAPPRGPHELSAGGEPPGGPRRAAGPEDDRLFPNLTDAEIDAAFAAAEGGPLVRVGADQPGADARPLAPRPAEEATFLQRQRAGALNEQADGLAAQAEGRLNDAIARDAEANRTEAYNPRRAARLREESNRLLNEAVELESRANGLRREAEEFSSGRRSATEDLPGPEDVDRMFAGLTSEEPGLVRVPLSDLERNPELLPRLIRPLLEGEDGGRMVFRVESERSRSLVTVDANGNVTVQGGASAHLNFGSFERAVEFVLQSSRGNARIIAFEVDEQWVRAARSAAIPEHETAAQAGRQPRLVDVRFADDQLEIPPGLIGELNRHIIPGSGVVHEIPARGPRTSGGESSGGDGVAPTGGGAAAEMVGTRMRLGNSVVVTDAPAALAHATDAIIGHVSAIGDAAIDSTHVGGGTAVTLTNAEGKPLRVRVIVAETESGDVASFRPATKADGDFDYVVRLSPRAPEDTHARAIAHELAELRVHGTAHASRADALRNATRVPEPARLSAHDVGRLAELEVLARRVTAVPATDVAARAAVHAEIDALAAHLGLLHSADNDVRMRLAQSALPKGSPARQALEASRARAVSESADALAPGRAVDPSRPLTAADRRRLAQLEEVLSRLPPAPADLTSEAPQVQALRRHAETLAAEMGLVFGQHAGRRAALAQTVLGDPAIVARLAEIRSSGQRNPLLMPLTGTPVDVPILLRQMQAAQAMGDTATATRLAQVAGLHLEEAGAFSTVRAEQVSAARIMREIREPALRALLADVQQRHAARLEAPRLRAEAQTVRERIARRRADERPGGAPGQTPASAERRQRLEGLEARARTLDSEAAALDRVASRPQDMSSASARAYAGRPEDFPIVPRVDAVPAMMNEPRNARLVRQLFSDSPDFQSWGAFAQTRRDVFTGLSFSEIGEGRTRALDFETLRRADSLANAYAQWVRGHYVDPVTGQYNQLADLRVIKPQASTAVATSAHLGSADTVSVSRRSVDPASGEVVRSVLPMTPDAAAIYRESLLARRNVLMPAIEALPEGSAGRRVLEAELSRVSADISESSESLGVAAGRKVADERGYVADPNLVIPRGGAGVPDLVYRDANGRLVIIECKGPRAGQVDRRAEVDGVPVMARQGTPEYMRSLAVEMAGSSDPQIRRLGITILAEMPNVEYLLVKQTARADETLGPIDVQRFDMTKPGR